MPGFSKDHRRFQNRRKLPASRYDDPRGGRPSAIERNILRYRAIEATLYLFYHDQVSDFMLSNVYPRANKAPDAPFWEPLEEQRLTRLLARILMDAETRQLVGPDDAEALRDALSSEYQRGRKLKTAFGHAIKIGMFSEAEANELQRLLSYRNDIAHRIHLLVADITRTSWNSDFLSFTAPRYKGEALERLRRYARTLWRRSQGKIILELSLDHALFDRAERVYDEELTRLDRKIRKLVAVEQARTEAIRAELDLSGTELVGDLAPRFYHNHRPDRSYGDDYVPPTGHLTGRGAEICYRLYDLGRSPIAVAYLMGVTLRSAERRRLSWLKAGGPERIRREVVRYDLTSGRRA